MNRLYKTYIKKESLPTLFCPGCGNGIIQVAAMEAMEKLQCKDKVACVSGIGCSSWIPCYYKLDVLHGMHGRALPFAEGLKLSRPEKKVLVFTGDGDCTAIGGNHLVHAAARNVDLTVVMVNNHIYGMTGGQKSPTTPKGSITKTSPFGNVDDPIDAVKMVLALGASYVARWTTVHPVQLARSIAEGMAHKGFAFIEVLSQCPVQAGKSIWKEKDPYKIMEQYKRITYPYGRDNESECGKIPVGVFRYDKDRQEYTDKLKGMMRKMGKRGGKP